VGSTHTGDDLREQDASSRTATLPSSAAASNVLRPAGGLSSVLHGIQRGRGMSDGDEPRLRPASPEEVEQSLSFALRFDGRRRVHHADDAMARITAERLVAHLRKSGFVLMKRPEATAPSTSKHRHPNSD
jgi:hypothetical protein